MKIDFGNEITDDANAFDLTNDEWTIPSTGFYHINASARFNTLSINTLVEIVIYVNGFVTKYQKHSISGEENFGVIN